ncbi:AAA family ATPase [Haloplanus rubicundus]|uniref:AAA family ATPase n=1 Tax=Haloplanus rubicundus TaxID=1547898 RepID=UPI0016517B35|nr:ATP-binding protein [Haloplanus rubicundus]
MNEGSTLNEWLTEVGGEFSKLDVRIELRDENGNRRLHDLLNRMDGTNTYEDKDPVLRFSLGDPDHEVRYRYSTKPSEVVGERVRRYDRYVFDVVSIRGEKALRGLSFELEFEEATNEPTLPSGDPSTVGVSLSTVCNYDKTREFRVAGLDSERNAVMAFLDDDGDRWGLSSEHGMLLEGPPGTGKTEVVMEVCRELFGSVPVKISGPEILSRWVGESERILRERFETARDDPSNVLYIDEIDSIARSRGKSTQEYSAQIVAQLLVLLDGIDTKRDEDPVKVVASTNMAGVVDEALRRPGRLGRTQSFDTLDETDATAVLHHYLDEIRRHAGQGGAGELSEPLRKFVETGISKELSGEGRREELPSLLSGKTGADIEQIVQQATRIADEKSRSVSEADESGTVRLGVEDLYQAATDSVPSSRMVDPATHTTEGEIPTFAPTAPVVRIDPEEGKEKVRAAFARFLDTYDHERGEFREFVLTEDDALSDPAVLRTRLWEQFTPDDRYPVCVYIHEFLKIDRAAARSQVAETVVETVCDRLVAPPPLNNDAEPVLFGYRANSNTELPRLDRIAVDPRGSERRSNDAVDK